MKLYDYTKKYCKGYLDEDTYDTDYDRIVTVILDTGREDKDFYDKFTTGICKAVEVDTATPDLILKWSGLVEDNYNLFHDFACKFWIRVPKNREDFIYEWIREIHYYLAGYTSEDVYKAFCEDILDRIA